MKFYDSLAVHDALLRNRARDGEGAAERKCNSPGASGMRTAAASRLTVPLFLLVPPLFRERARATLHVADRHAAPIDTHLINRVNNTARVILVIGSFFFFFSFFPRLRKKSDIHLLLLRAPRERAFATV